MSWSFLLGPSQTWFQRQLENQVVQTAGHRHQFPVVCLSFQDVQSLGLLASNPMTCQVLVNNSSVKAHALLDSASSTSFVSEHLAQSLCLPRFHHNIRISGIAGDSSRCMTHSVRMNFFSEETDSVACALRLMNPRRSL